METEQNNPSSKDVNQSVKSPKVRPLVTQNIGKSLLKRASIAHTEGNVRKGTNYNQPDKLISGVPSLRCSVSINPGSELEYNDYLTKRAMFMSPDQGKNIESIDSLSDSELQKNGNKSSDTPQKMGTVFKGSRFSPDNFNVHIDGGLSMAQTFGRNSYRDETPKFQMGGMFGHGYQTGTFPLSKGLHGKRNSVTVGDSDKCLKPTMSLLPLTHSKAEDRPRSISTEVEP
jgi:hypothetical protein